MRVYGEVMEMESRKDQEEYLKKYECGDIVLKMLDGAPYARTIWKHILPKQKKLGDPNAPIGTGRDIIKKYLGNAEYIGEDGGMVTDGYITKEEARNRMIARWKEDCGEVDAKEFAENMTVDELVEGYFHLMTPAVREEMGADADCEWYVSVSKVSGYKVWIYWG